MTVGSAVDTDVDYKRAFSQLIALKTESRSKHTSGSLSFTHSEHLKTRLQKYVKWLKKCSPLPSLHSFLSVLFLCPFALSCRCIFHLSQLWLWKIRSEATPFKAGGGGLESALPRSVLIHCPRRTFLMFFSSLSVRQPCFLAPVVCLISHPLCS